MFRFAAQLSTSPDGTARGWADQARAAAEDLGYSTLLMPDRFGDQLAPLPALAAAAVARPTTTLPRGLAGDVQRLPAPGGAGEGGGDPRRVERRTHSMTPAGAGWMRTDYEQSGIPYDSPKERVDRFEEAVQVLQGLMRTDGPFSFAR